MIYYVSLDNPNPSGGVKTQYRHVEILNKNGYNAAMLHQKPGFTAATWFSSSAPIHYAPLVEIVRGDVLVWPEILRSSIHYIPNVKQVIFNQNVHYTHRGTLYPGLPYQPGSPRFDYRRDIVGTMVLTEYERIFLREMVGRDHPIHVVKHGIDPSIWAYDGREKEKIICYMPRKHLDEAEAVFGWLSVNGTLAGWRVECIDGQPEDVVAELFKRSGYFFAFGYPEGGTLPPFEALAAGCQVIGYGGFASDDYLSDQGGRKIPSGDTCQFARVASILLANPHLSPEMGYQRSKKCLDFFSMKGEEEQLLRFMKEVVI